MVVYLLTQYLITPFSVNNALEDPQIGNIFCDQIYMQNGDGAGDHPAGEKSDCPCVNGKPYMHVMKDLSASLGGTVGWKKGNFL